MAAISSTSSSLVTSWSTTDKIHVNYIKYSGIGEPVEVSIKPSDSIQDFASNVSKASSPLPGMSFTIIRNYPFSLYDPPSTILRERKIILHKESDVYHIAMSWNMSVHDLPIDEDLKIQVGFCEGSYLGKFFENYYYATWRSKSQLSSYLGNIYGLLRDNHVNYRKRMLEGFSSSEISLQYPESDMRIISKAGELLNSSGLSMTAETIQSIACGYFKNLVVSNLICDYYFGDLSEVSLNKPANLSKLLFNAIQLRFSYEGTRDEEEVITYFKQQYIDGDIKPCIDEIVEARESGNDENLRQSVIVFVKKGLSLIKNVRGQDSLINSSTENAWVEELYSSLKNPNKTIFSALNTLIKQFVILRQRNDNQQYKIIMGSKEYNLRLSGNISMRQLYLLMTEQMKDLRIADPYRFRILKLTRWYSNTNWGLQSLRSVRARAHGPSGETIDDVLTYGIHGSGTGEAFSPNTFICHHASTFSPWTNVLYHNSDSFTSEMRNIKN